MQKFSSTKIIELGSCAFRQPNAKSHCKYVHGYRLIAKVWLCADELDENNWVFDFGSFKELTNSLQKTFDHKLVLDKNDPAKSVFKELERYGAVSIVEMDGVGIEKFAQYVFEQTDTYVKFVTKNRVWCEKVEVFEHEKNSAIYRLNVVNELISKTDPKEIITGTQLTEEIKTPLVAAEAVPPNNGPRPAPLTSPITKGWSNPFAGTSWGA